MIKGNPPQKGATKVHPLQENILSRRWPATCSSQGSVIIFQHISAIQTLNLHQRFVKWEWKWKFK